MLCLPANVTGDGSRVGFACLPCASPLYPLGYPSGPLEVLPGFGSQQTPFYDPHLRSTWLLVDCKARGT